VMKDVQNQSDTRGVEIQKVGIKGLELPLAIQRKDAEDIVIYSAATAGVTLPAHYKGTHMSRFVEVLNEWRSKKTLGIDIKGCVEAIVQKLDAKCGYLKFDFKYFINKKSPVTGISAPMCYDCFFEGILDNYGEEDETSASASGDQKASNEDSIYYDIKLVTSDGKAYEIYSVQFSDMEKASLLLAANTATAYLSYVSLSSQKETDRDSGTVLFLFISNGGTAKKTEKESIRCQRGYPETGSED